MTTLSEIGQSIRAASELNQTPILKRIQELKDKIKAIHGSPAWASELLELQVEVDHLERQLAVNGNF